jgi:hypothetical protein
MERIYSVEAHQSRNGTVLEPYWRPILTAPDEASIFLGMPQNASEKERIFKYVVQVSEEEQEKINQKAKRHGLSGPAFLRMLGLTVDELQPQPSR